MKLKIILYQYYLGKSYTSVSLQTCKDEKLYRETTIIYKIQITYASYAHEVDVKMNIPSCQKEQNSQGQD